VPLAQIAFGGTPPEVVDTLVQSLEPSSGDTIYCPFALGLESMLRFPSIA
jgi:hypothetical protein